jgi:serine/threonine-protein kinase ATR
MVNGLLALCDFPAPDPPRNPDAKNILSMKKDIPQLSRLMPSPLIVPLQESLTVILPPTSAATNSLHQPFRPDIPTFHGKPLLFLYAISYLREMVKFQVFRTTLKS